MNIPSKDAEILKELGRQYAEIAADPVNAQRMDRYRRSNDLERVRPIVLIDEIPWNEMDVDGLLINRCEDEFARKTEITLRRLLYKWKYMQADMVAPAYIPLRHRINNSGIGISVEEHTRVYDSGNNIVAHEYIDQLKTEADLEKLHPPVLTMDEEADKEAYETLTGIFNGILPVRFVGSYFSFAPWDQISMFRGVTDLLMDLAERPEFMHKTIQKFMDIGFSQLEQMEKIGGLDADLVLLHCTPAPSGVLPVKAPGEKYKARDVWGRGTAQIFGSVSGAMHKEFEIDYVKPLFQRFGLLYYGCCEPLDKKIDLLRAFKNLRKISISPWADPARAADAIGSDYVLSAKPNPAHVAVNVFDPSVVRKEVRTALLACRKNNTPVEFIIKDISTVNYRPQNLMEWEKTVMEEVRNFQ